VEPVAELLTLAAHKIEFPAARKAIVDGPVHCLRALVRKLDPLLFKRIVL
jgi:hypothetical protein